MVGALVSISDFALRPAKGMNDGEVLITGQHRLRFTQTPHVPHCWEAGMLFEETRETLFCTDLFHQGVSVEPHTTGGAAVMIRSQISGRAKPHPYNRRQSRESATKLLFTNLDFTKLTFIHHGFAACCEDVALPFRHWSLQKLWAAPLVLFTKN